MPWNFPWTEFLKKRACRYILQHYLGHFLKEKLTLDQLSVDLYNGTGKIKELELDVESLNEALDSSNVPLEIVDGFVEEISVAIPWTRLIQNSTELEIHGLQLTLQPKQRKEHVSGLEVMFNSMSSMNTSLQIAEDCLKSAKSDEVEQEIDMGQPYEGVQKFAQTIDSVLCRVKVTLVDTIIRIEHLPVNSDKGVALEIRIKRMEYYDDMAKEEGSPVDDPERGHLWEPAAIAHKNIVLEGVQLLSDQFSRQVRQGDTPVDSPCSTPQAFMSTVSSLSPESFDKTPTASQETLTDPIQIAVLTGRTGLKLKIKQGEAIQGPKIETDLDIGGLHILLSPQQFHGLIDLIEGLMSPDTNDGTSKKGRGNKNKPMSPDDYKKVETELQRHLASGRVQQQQHQFLQTQYMGMGMQDIMTQSIGEVGDEQYFSLTADKMRGMQSSVNSNYSTSSQRTTSTVSTTRQGQRKDSRSSKDSMHRILDDPSAELCRYHFRLAFFSLCLLHENPSQQVQLASPSKGHNSPTKMRDISMEYFQNVFSFTAAGKSDLRALRNRFSDVLQVDHLRFVGKPLNVDCTEKTVTTHQSLTLDLTLGLFECLECLYNRTTDNAIPEYTELLVFPRDGSDKPSQMYSSMHVGSPAIKASVKTVEQIRGQQRVGSHPRTEVSISLGKLECEVDLTIVDRVNSLVKPEPLQRTLSNNSQTIHSDAFSQTLEEGSLTQDKKYDLTVSTSQVKVTFRIPIPDLRAVSEVGKLPWWQKNLRDEILVFDIHELRFQTAFLSSQSLQQIEFSCKELEASFRIDPNQSPVPFAVVSCEGDSEDGFNLPQLLIKFSEKKMSVLEEEIDDSSGDTPQDSLNGACEFTKKDPSPFSSRKYMYGKEEMSEKDHTATHISHEMVLPGDRDEMAQFQEKACNNCLMNVDIILPRVNLFIPNKHFYEVLYNRLNNDLLLWEPMAPSPIATTSSGSYPIQPFDLSCYTQVLQENFSMAKSALQYESSSDEEDLYGPHYSIHDSRHPRQKQGRLKLPSKLCLSLRIDSGKLTAYTDSKETGCHGETVAMVNDANLFVVSHYTGDPCLQYVCFRSASAELYHSGAVIDSHKVTSVTQIDIDNTPPHLTCHKLISRSEPGLQTNQSTDSSLYMDNTDMVSVAVRVRLDSTPIGDLTTDEKIKEFLVAVGISGGTLRHKMAVTGQSWIAHFINFLDVKDYDILGYIMPKVLTELHVHLWSCAVDYRPLYIPTKAVLAAESFSISSNIVANSPTSLLRFVLDDAALYLSQRKEREEINITEDYVSIIDLERFELELRSSEGKDQRFPKTDLRVLTNKINLRTCSDSCQALMELIQYFATDGDLVAEGDVISSIHGDDIVPDLGHKEEADKSSREDESSSLSEPTLSQSKIDQLHTLVEDAMQESSSGSDLSEPTLSQSKIDQLHTQVEDAMQESSSGSENQDSLSPTRPSTEVFFVANTDQKSQDAPPAGVMRPIVISASADSVTSSAMSETVDALSDDEEFCIIDDPGLGIMPKHGEPEIRVFTSDPIEIKENHFSQPLGRTDLLKVPDHFPYPEYSYTLKELTIVWFMYGGRDFGDAPERMEKEVMQVRKTSDAGEFQYDVAWQYMTSAARVSLSHDRIPWQIRGGPGRDLDTLMELQLTKVRMQYDIYPSHTEEVSRQVLVINDIEMRDRLANSNINKFLYQYSSESLPKQTHANMVVIKAVHSRPDLTVKSQECALRVSLQPIRLNIDQDSLYFLTRFFTEIVGGTVESVPEVHSDLEKEGKGKRSRSSSGTTGPVAPPPVMKMGQPVSPIGESETQEPLMMFDEMQDSTEPREVTVEEPSIRLENEDQAEQESETLPVFIKSFVFSPDVPIRLDYHGKKWMDRERGTFVGLLVGLAQLNCSELKLKRLSYKHGLLGIDKVQAYCVNEWVNDILKNQLPSILGGVGPMHSFVQLAQGIKDLFWLPVEQYKRDGRLVRGIQRGATSFSTSTAMAMLELTNRAVQSVQYVAEVTYDVVTPGPSIRLQRRRLRGQPTDIREGMENAYIAIREGFSSTAHNIVDVTKKEHEQKGFTGAMGAAFRLVPPTVISPVIIAADATSNVLGGMRNQLKPDAKKEDDEKWKANQT